MRPAQYLALAWPLGVTVSDDFRRVIRFLGWRVRPETVVRAGYGLGVTIGAAGLLLTTLVPVRPRAVAVAVTIALSLGSIHVAHGGPRLLATARRTRALGTAPTLVLFAALRLRLAPSPERAAVFAARTAAGPLAESLEAHVKAARGRSGAGFESFGAEWADWFPALDRASDLLVAAGRVPPADRDQTLDRGLAVVLEGAERRMRSHSSSIQGPVTALYAFGVLLPVALVSLVPAARAAGLPITLPLVVGLYDVVLPVALLVVGAWLLSRRPIAVPPPALDAAHPDVPNRRASAVAVGSVAGLVSALATATWLPQWTPPIAGVGAGIGTGLLFAYRPYRDVRERIYAVEEGLPDAMSIIGHRVARGVAVERAIESATTDLDGPIRTVLARGTRRQTALGVGIERGFLEEGGALSTIPSPRIHGSARLLAVAAREGRPAGEALVTLADHLEDLRRVERESRGTLERVVKTLRSTGAYFGPLVGGATVALAGHLSTGKALVDGATRGIPWLGLAVGGYVLAMAVILSTLSVGLERGLDRSLVGEEVGKSLLVATASYLGGYLIAGAVA
jgi:hypothetical protein